METAGMFLKSLRHKISINFVFYPVPLTIAQKTVILAYH